MYMVLKDANGYPAHTFLNKMFISLSSSYFDFLGIAMFGGFALYLIFCVMKGNIKFGVRLVFFTFHPMK